ncbi:hypothetical protein [Streptomyces sp. NPDC057702]|uniref:hypothetical protein n=1 Tax=Streptomyces sp. NPDC057702 TaxID=3346221 RepID=UPI003693AA34
MTTLRTGCVAIAGVLVFLVYRWSSYPGSWASMFSVEYAGPRAALASRRRTLRRAERASRGRRNAAARDVEQAESAYRDAVDAAERLVASLRQDTPGSRVTGLGRIAVHEHAVRVFDEDGPLDATGRHRTPAGGASTDLPLVGLTVTCTAAHEPSGMSLTLTSESGTTVQVDYPDAEYPEPNVRQFALDAANAAVRARAAQTGRAERIARAEAELAEARGATQDIEAARERRREVTAAENSDSTVSTARAALAEQWDTWETITGHRPGR